MWEPATSEKFKLICDGRETIRRWLFLMVRIELRRIDGYNQFVLMNDDVLEEVWLSLFEGFRDFTRGIMTQF